MSLLRTSTPKYRGDAETLTVEDRDHQGPLDWLKSLFRTRTPNYHRAPVVHQGELAPADGEADPAATDPPPDAEQ